MKRYIIPIIGILSMTAFVTFWYFEKRGDDAVMRPSPERQEACERFLTVAIFPSGEAADAFMEACLRGEPVLPEDDVEGVDELLPVGGVESHGPVVGSSCAIGGCSNQLCGEAGEVEGMVTTCEYREEYACLVHARCERQASGKCGWTETAAYGQCRADVAAR